jgi:DNA gyrase subunit B
MVRFKPDPEIFKTTLEFDFDRVATRLDELAYLNAGLVLTLTDNRCDWFLHRSCSDASI